MHGVKVNRMKSHCGGIKNKNLKEPRVMITTGSSLSGMNACVMMKKTFYPNMPKLPTPVIMEMLKRNYYLKIYALDNGRLQKLYWTDYVLGLVKTRITCWRRRRSFLMN